MNASTFAQAQVEPACAAIMDCSAAAAPSTVTFVNAAAAHAARRARLPDVSALSDAWEPVDVVDGAPGVL